MKKLIFYTAIIVPFFFSSCAKNKGLGEEYHYGKVQVQRFSLPDTPEMDLFLDGEKPTDWNSIALPVLATIPSRISVYVKGTHDLIADTTVTVARDQLLYLSVAYSAEFGLKGFYFGQHVPEDSVRMRFKYALDQNIYPFPNVDVHLFRSTDTTAAAVVAIVENLSFGATYSPAVTTLPSKNEQGGTINYVIKMKDRLSGQFIRDKGRKRDYMTRSGSPGTYFYLELSDNKGEATVNNFLLNAVAL
jgi:hypothetical protein